MLSVVRALGCSIVLSGALLGSAIAADLPTKAPAVPYLTGPWLELFGGLVVAPDSTYGYAGGVVAFNHDLNKDGFLFRVAGGDGHYKYDIVPGVGNGVDFQTGEVMVGYQAYFGPTRITGYVGANVEDHHNNTDPLAFINGTKWGVKGQGEILTPIGQSVYLYGQASYSSVWNNYFVMGKAGYNITPAISIGPEVVSLGNDRFDAVRVGPFIGINITPSAQIILSGGYSWDTRNDNINNQNGAYGALHVRVTF
jgi:hypothetical protein